MLTNINCTSNCIYQTDGKCGLENISQFSGNTNDSCMYFTERKNFKNQKDYQEKEK